MIFDEKLIKRIKKGDNKKIILLYKFTYNKIMSIAVRYYVNEEDKVTIINNSFMKIINNIEKFELGTSYFSWVNRIVYNEIISAHRKEKNYKTFFNFETSDLTVDKIQNADVIENEGLGENDLLKMIAKLPKATRIVFDMYAVEGGYTYKEIAESLDISSETVKWHLKHARRALKEMIKTHNSHEYAS